METLKISSLNNITSPPTGIQLPGNTTINPVFGTNPQKSHIRLTLATSRPGSASKSNLRCKTGDCWLLAACLAAENTNQDKTIFIHYDNENGDSGDIVTLGGDTRDPAKTIKVSNDDLNSPQYENFSTGDEKMKELEIAEYNYYKQNGCSNDPKSPNPNPVLFGGYESNIDSELKLLTGKDPIKYYNNNQMNESNPIIQQLTKINNKGPVSIVASTLNNVPIKLFNQYALDKEHSVAIANVTNGQVTYYDPNNGLHTISINDAAQCFGILQAVEN